MNKFFNITRYPTIIVFALAGLMIIVVAFLSFNLLTQGMANIDFYSRTWMAGNQSWWASSIAAIAVLWLFVAFRICRLQNL